MKIDTKTQYYNSVVNKPFYRFIIGILPRLKQWIHFSINRIIARKKGAYIGENVIIRRHIAKKANKNLSIGENSSIDARKIDLRSPILIGKNVIIGYNTEIITTSHYIDSPEYEHKYYGLEIEDYVWITSNVLILPSCRKIGYGSIIAAGSVVAKDVPPMSVVGGNPATIIKKRMCVHNKLIVPSLLGGDFKFYISCWLKSKKRL